LVSCLIESRDSVILPLLLHRLDGMTAVAVNQSLALDPYQMHRETAPCGIHMRWKLKYWSHISVFFSMCRSLSGRFRQFLHGCYLSRPIRFAVYFHIRPSCSKKLVLPCVFHTHCTLQQCICVRNNHKSQWSAFVKSQSMHLEIRCTQTRVGEPVHSFSVSRDLRVGWSVL
jgi:hypothetical protein